MCKPSIIYIVAEYLLLHIAKYILRLILYSKVAGYYENEMKNNVRVCKCANVQIIFTIEGEWVDVQMKMMCRYADVQIKKDVQICGCANVHA